jgi:chemotaxis protein methyltransferase CheR
MTAALPEPLLIRLGEHIAKQFGLDFPQHRRRDLDHAVRSAYDRHLDRAGLEGFVHRLLSSTSTHDLQLLIEHLTVGETYFFREMRSLELIGQQIVPDWLQSRELDDRPIRIWSAGCATGEEPYSVAILLGKLIPDLKHLTILATDLNVSFLERASAGVYGEWSFRGTPEWLKHSYFSGLPRRRWSISPLVKRMVTFRQLNLMEDVYPSPLNGTDGLDLILCRNVLMYCTSRAMKEILRRFHRCLADRGWLIVGTAEVACTVFNGFDRVSLGDTTIYRKQSLRRAIVKSHAETVDRLVAEKSVVVKEAEETAPREGAPIDLVPRSPRNISKSSTTYEQAFELYQSGDYPEAEQMSLALLSANPNDSLVALLLARIYANLGKFREALDQCQRALAENKMFAAAYYLRALILEEQGLLDEAGSSLQRATYADSRFILGHFALGNLAAKHAALGNPSKHYENALALLAQCEPDEIVPESEGLSAGELRRIVLENCRRRGQHVGLPRPLRSKSQMDKD